MKDTYKEYATKGLRKLIQELEGDFEPEINGSSYSTIAHAVLKGTPKNVRVSVEAPRLRDKGIFTARVKIGDEYFTGADKDPNEAVVGAALKAKQRFSMGLHLATQAIHHLED